MIGHMLQQQEKAQQQHYLELYLSLKRITCILNQRYVVAVVHLVIAQFRTDVRTLSHHKHSQ
jgi:hypothetical protein